MIQTVYNGTTYFLVNEAPNWLRGFKSSHTSVTDQQESLTHRETRRPYAVSLRTKLSFTSTISGPASLALAGQLRQLKAQPVLCPFWPAVSFWSNRASMKISGGLMIAFKRDWSQLEVYAPGGEPSWPAASDMVAPLLQGFISSQQPTFVNVNTSQWQVEFTEAGPVDYALTFATSAFATGPQPAGYTAAPTLLPHRPDFKTITEPFKVTVTRVDGGLQREQPATFYPHDPWAAQEATYTLSGVATIAQIIGWYQATSGNGAAFWASSAFSCGSSTAAIGSAATSFTISDPSAIQIGDYLCAYQNGTLAVAKVTGISGSTISITAFGTAIPANWPLFRLMLVRLDSQSLDLDWLSLDLVTARLKWTEVRPETVVPLGETVGVTIGQMPQRAVLVQFTADYGNGTVDTTYWTSYESDIVYGGHTWSHGKFDVGDVAGSINFESDGCDIVSSLVLPDGSPFTANPLFAAAALQLECVLGVKVWFADYAAPTASNVVQVFTGEVASVSRSGNKITAKCIVGASIFQSSIPTFARGTMCNNLRGTNADGSYLISYGCALLKADWKFTAVVANPVSLAFPFHLNASGLARVTGPAPTYFADWFAFGRVEWGAGNRIQRRAILASTVPVAGALTLTLHKLFNGLPAAGDALVIYPGCDGLYSTCKAYDGALNPTGKFNNYANFGGSPFIPTTNPALSGQPSLGTQGSKK